MPTDCTVVDRPELLFLACPRDAVYLNTALRFRAGADQLPELVAEVSRAHTGGSRAFVYGDDPALERALVGHGYAPTDEHDGYSLAVGAYGRSSALEVRRVADRDGMLDLLEVAGLAFGHRSETNEAEIEQYVQACRDPAGRVHRFVAYLDGQPVSAGGLTAHPALSLGFLWAGGTVPGARGLGAYTAVLAARIAKAAQLGLQRVGLYARRDTSAPIVAAHGFERHEPMVAWDRLRRGA